MRSLGWVGKSVAVSLLALTLAVEAVADGKPPEKRPEPVNPAPVSPGSTEPAVTNVVDGATEQPAVDLLQLRMDYVNQLREAIQRELAPTEEEVTKLNEVFDRNLEKLTGIVNDLRQLRERNAVEIESLQKEMEGARENRDSSRYRSLMSRLQELRGRDDSLSKPLLVLESDVRGALDREKNERLQALMYRLQEPFRRLTGVKPASLAVVMVRFREVEPTKEQNDQMQTILREVSPALRDAAKKLDREGMKKVEDEFRGRVLALLTDEQRTRYLEIEKTEEAE